MIQLRFWKQNQDIYLAYACVRTEAGNNPIQPMHKSLNNT